MLELKKQGLYIANGKNTSVLIRVVGEAPCLSIISGVLLNDMQRSGKVTVLGANDPEIQDIVSNPKNYVFDLPAISDAIHNEKGLDSETITEDFTDKDLNGWIEDYKEKMALYPTNYRVKMQVMLISKKYSKTQADHIIDRIEKILRWQPGK